MAKKDNKIGKTFDSDNDLQKGLPLRKPPTQTTRTLKNPPPKTDSKK